MRIPKRSDSVTKSIAINKKDPNESDLFRQVVEIRESSYSERTRKARIFVVFYLRERAA